MITIKFELNRAWIINEEGDTIGETNFVVPGDWLLALFNKKYANEKTINDSNKYESFNNFLDLYEPEVEGEFIYQEAIKDDVLVEDLGIVMYKKYNFIRRI